MTITTHSAVLSTTPNLSVSVSVSLVFGSTKLKA